MTDYWKCKYCGVKRTLQEFLAILGYEVEDTLCDHGGCRNCFGPPWHVYEYKPEKL